MDESAMWAALRPRLRLGGGHAVRVENGVEAGTPDVNYCIEGVEGWIELKYAKAWPVREKTPLRVRHYTEEQKDWARARLKAGGRCSLLLRVGSEHLLFNGPCMLLVGEVPRRELIRVATMTWSKALPGDELRSSLIGREGYTL